MAWPQLILPPSLVSAVEVVALAIKFRKWRRMMLAFGSWWILLKRGSIVLSYHSSDNHGWMNCTDIGRWGVSIPDDSSTWQKMKFVLCVSGKVRLPKADAFTTVWRWLKTFDDIYGQYDFGHITTCFSYSSMAMITWIVVELVKYFIETIWHIYCLVLLLRVRYS